MIIGYARVSTVEQHEHLQIDALQAAGCEEIFTDKMSGTKWDRPELEKVKAVLRKGDTLVVWKLDRLGRNLGELIKLVNSFKEKGVNFISLKEHIDTTSAIGNLLFHIFGALAEFERELLVERTKAGLQASRARGKKGGRPRIISPKKVKQMVDYYYEHREVEVKDIAEMFGVSRSTLFKYVRLANQQQTHPEAIPTKQ